MKLSLFLTGDEMMDNYLTELHFRNDQTIPLNTIICVGLVYNSCWFSCWRAKTLLQSSRWWSQSLSGMAVQSQMIWKEFKSGSVDVSHSKNSVAGAAFAVRLFTESTNSIMSRMGSGSTTSQLQCGSEESLEKCRQGEDVSDSNDSHRIHRVACTPVGPCRKCSVLFALAAHFITPVLFARLGPGSDSVSVAESRSPPHHLCSLRARRDESWPTRRRIPCVRWCRSCSAHGGRPDGSRTFEVF